MNFSFQLYGARNFPPVLDILPKLKALGYAQVEGYSDLYGTVPDLAGALKHSGLSMPTGHFGLDDLKDASATMKLAESLGIRTLFCPAISTEDRDDGDAGWINLADTLAEFGETYSKAGFNIGWHNHDFEFTPTNTGKLPLELILDGAPNILWQHDVAWAVVGGQDPLKWIDRYAGRIASIHVKDIAPSGACADEDGWADVGHGTMDWPAIIAAVRGKTSCNSFVMEHDNPNDVVRFATRSIETARQFEGFGT